MPAPIPASRLIQGSISENAPASPGGTNAFMNEPPKKPIIAPAVVPTAARIIPRKPILAPRQPPIAAPDKTPPKNTKVPRTLSRWGNQRTTPNIPENAPTNPATIAPPVASLTGGFASIFSPKPPMTNPNTTPRNAAQIQLPG